MTSPTGDQLVRPLNAPAVSQPAVGIQPGSTGTVIAHLVIVAGTGGAIYVYNGTAGAGKLIGSWTSAAGTDPYGNVVPSAGLNIYGIPPLAGGLISMDLDPGTGDAILTMSPSNNVAPTNVAAPPSVQTVLEFPATSVERQQMIIQSGTETGGTVAEVRLTSQSFDHTVSSLIELIATNLDLESTFPAMQFVCLNATQQVPPPSFQAFTSSPGAVNEQVQLTLSTGNENAHDNAAIIVNAAAADNSSPASVELFVHPSAVLTSTKSAMSIFVPVTATSGALATPTLITTDTWHLVNSFANGWVISGSGVNAVRYRLTTDNETEIEWDLINPVAVGGTSLVTTLPAGYFNPGFTRNAVAQTAAGGAGWVFIDGSGDFNIVGYTVAAKEIWGYVRIPLS